MGKPYKTIELKLENQKVYSIEAKKVADDRAKYYSENDNKTTYQEEYDYTICDEDELRDWLLNNMEWRELSPVFVRDESGDGTNSSIEELEFFHESEQSEINQ